METPIKTDCQRIHEWLGKCWHESNGVGTLRDGGYYCKKCGDSDALAPFPAEWDANGNSQYDTDATACLALIEAVRAKDEDWRWHIDALKLRWDIEIYDAVGREVLGVGEGETMPAAVSNAVIALINSIEGETKC